MDTPKTAKRAAIYCRISDDKAGEALGIIRQQADCEKLAKSLGWTIAQIITDNDRSAYSGRTRPGYNELLDGLKDGTFDGVIAWHSDRLHRRPIELEDYIHICQTQGVRTQTVKGGEVDLTTPEGMLRAGMLGQIARYESAHKSDRITRAHQQAAEQGKWRGGARPFGYLDGASEPHPTEAPLVEQAYAAVLRGESIHSIARTWNDLGLRGRQGAKFSTITVRTILLRERNIGHSMYKGEVVNREAFTPIIDEGTYLQVKAILKDPARRTTVSTTGKWLLSGLALCGVCEASGIVSVMAAGQVRSRDKKTSHTIYKCRTFHHMGRRAEYCDAYIADLVMDRLQRPDARNLLHHKDGKGVPEAHKEAEVLRKKLSEYASMLAEDLMTPSQFRDATAITRQRLATAEKQLFAPGKSPALVALIQSPEPRSAWAEMTWSQKRSVINALMVVTVLPTERKSSRVFNPKYIRIDWTEGQ